MLRQSLIALRGPMAVGKSTLAQALGQHLAMPVVDKDAISDILINYLEPYGQASYEVLFSLVQAFLGQGLSLIVDSPLRSPLGLQKLAALAQQASCPLYVLDCHCPSTELWQQRLEGRTPSPAQVLRTWADFEKYWQKAASEFCYPIAAPHLNIDTSVDVRRNVLTICHWIDEMASRAL